MKHSLLEDRFSNLKTKNKLINKLDNLFHLPSNKFVWFSVLGLIIILSINTFSIKSDVEKKSSKLQKNVSDKIEYAKWFPCDDGYCATIKVPLDYNGKVEGKIDIALFKNSNKQSNKPVVLVNPGGPGGSGIEVVKNATVMYSKNFLKNVQLIGWDPRGVGSSTKTQCANDLDYMFVDVDASPDTQLEKDKVLKTTKQFYDSCNKKSKKIIPFINIINVTKDLEQIRKSLKLDKLNYIGYSYGTAYGQLYASMYPNNVGNFVFDGVVDLTIDDYTVSQSESFENVLNNFFTWCDATECDYINTTKEKLLTPNEQLTTSLNAKAAFLKLKELTELKEWTPDTFAGNNEISPTMFEIAVASTLYGDDEAWKSLDLALQAMANNDVSFLVDYANYYLGRDPSGSIKYDSSMESFLVHNCEDSVIDYSVANLDELTAKASANSQIMGGSAYLSYSQCMWWKKHIKEIKLDPNAFKDLKILFVATRNDPATPYSWADSVKSTFPASYLLTYNGTGHTIFGYKNECINGYVEKFLISGEYLDSDKECNPE